MMKDWLLQRWKKFISYFHQPPEIEFQDYVCLIHPKSSFLTPLQADTLWAALVWAHRYLYGAEKTEQFVKQAPPKIVISDGFPYQFLPRPRRFIPLQVVEKIVRDEFAGDDWDKYLVGIEIAKNLSEQSLLPIELVNELLVAGSDVEILKKCLRVTVCPKIFVNHHDLLIGPSVSQRIKQLKNKYCNPEHCDALTSWKNPDQKRERQLRCQEILRCKTLFPFQIKAEQVLRKNVIHRAQMTTLEQDGLYSHRETYLLGELWWIFIRAHDIERDHIFQLFEFLEKYGFGKRKSTGKGQFEIRGLKPLSDYYTIPTVTEPDGFMALSSSFVPQANEAIPEHYSFHVKRGKVDGHLSTGDGKFIKYPIAMYQAGSTFRIKQKQSVYGQLVKRIHPDKNIVQFGYTFPLMGNFFDRRNG